MTLPFLAALVYFVLLSGNPLARWIYGATKAFTLVWPIVVVLLWFGEPFPWPEWRHGKHRSAWPLGLLSGGIIAGLMLAVAASPFREVLTSSASDIEKKVRDLGVLNHYWAFGFFIAFLHSFLEEYYWRWFVFGQLRKICRPSLAYVGAAVSFAAHHIVIATQFFPWGWGLLFGSLVGVGGACWCWMYQRQQTLAGAWVSHVLADLGILTIGHKVLFGTWF